MNKEWVASMKAKELESANKAKQDVIQFLYNNGRAILSNNDMQLLCRLVETWCRNKSYMSFYLTFSLIEDMRKHKIEYMNSQKKADGVQYIGFAIDSKGYPESYQKHFKYAIENIGLDHANFFMELFKRLELLLSPEYKHVSAFNGYSYYDGLLDSELVRFTGDIIITDPCYILKSESDMTDKEKKLYKKYSWGDLSVLGFKTYLSHDTLYGDWSCTVFNGQGKPIGEFCADGSMVAVMLLSEVLKYNSKFNYHITKTWTTTWIKDFDGLVQIQIVEVNDDYEVRVVGHGVNRKSKEQIDFFSRQTGL